MADWDEVFNSDPEEDASGRGKFEYDNPHTEVKISHIPVGEKRMRENQRG